jgi:hypothetical protein
MDNKITSIYNKVNIGSYSGSFWANVELPRILGMFLYIIHMDMVLNFKISLV